MDPQVAAAFAAMQEQMQLQMQAQQDAHARDIQQMQQQMHQQQQHAQQAVLAAQQAALQVALQAAQQPQPQRAPAMRVAPVGPFTGSIGTLDGWVSLMQQQFDFYAYAADVDRIRAAAVTLRDAALDWWQQLDPAAMPATWADMVALLRTRFQPIDRAETARAAMYALKQGSGTTADYVSKFRRLLGAVPTMGADDQLFQFKRGLNDSTAKQLNINGVATLDAAVAMAVRVGAHASSSAHAAAAAPAPMDLDNIEGVDRETEEDNAPVSRSDFQQLLAAMQHQRGRAPGTGSNGRGAQGAQGPYAPRGLPRIAHLSEQQVKERMESGACFGCASTDHRSRQCPKRTIKDGRVSWSQAK